MNSTIDHLVVIAPNLAAGRNFIQEKLGVEPETGGAHPRMGTHNLLLSLGKSMYLEVIAKDPALPNPDRPRWFGLDAEPEDFTPRFAAWVARTDEIHGMAPEISALLGQPEEMSRGDLSWLCTIAPGGSPPLGGAAPALIQWPATRHPALNLKDAGCNLEYIRIYHPEPEIVTDVFRGIGLTGKVLVTAGAPVRLSAFLSVRGKEVVF